MSSSGWGPVPQSEPALAGQRSSGVSPPPAGESFPRWASAHHSQDVSAKQSNWRRKREEHDLRRVEVSFANSQTRHQKTASRPASGELRGILQQLRPEIAQSGHSLGAEVAGERRK